MSSLRTTTLFRRLAVLAAGSAVAATVGLHTGRAGAEEAAAPAATRADAVLEAGPIQPASADTAPVEQLLTFTVNDVAGAWARTYAATTIRYLWVLPGQVFQTSCGLTSLSVAFYCPADDAMYVDAAFAGSVEAQLGDMAAAMIVAHEYGHNLQGELGVASDPNRALPTELHADCLAGAWARDAYLRGVADDGDLDEAVAGARAAGDYEVGDPGHHGLPEQRAEATIAGINGQDCNPYLWL